MLQGLCKLYRSSHSRNLHFLFGKKKTKTKNKRANYQIRSTKLKKEDDDENK